MSLPVKLRQHIERRIARRCIADLLDAGYTITINDGEEDVYTGTDRKAALAAMFTTDEDYIVAKKSVGKDHFRISWVRFIYGNSGWDVINDYTTNLEEVLTKTQALADKIEEFLS